MSAVCEDLDRPVDPFTITPIFACCHSFCVHKLILGKKVASVYIILKTYVCMLDLAILSNLGSLNSGYRSSTY